MIARLRDTSWGPWAAAAVMVLFAVLASAAIVIGSLAFVRTRERAVQVAHNAQAATQQNVRARYDDCQAAEQLRAALRAQVQEGKLTEPLLYKLVPSLDTPEVHKIIADQRRRQLDAYRPRDCKTFALAAVPPGQRADFRVP